MGAICLKFGTVTGNYPILRNMYENCDLRVEFGNYGVKCGENGQNQRKRDFWKTTKNASPPAKSSVWAKNHTRTAKSYYLEILGTDFCFFFIFRKMAAIFKPKIQFFAILGLKWPPFCKKSKNKKSVAKISR